MGVISALRMHMPRHGQKVFPIPLAAKPDRKYLDWHAAVLHLLFKKEHVFDTASTPCSYRSSICSTQASFNCRIVKSPEKHELLMHVYKRRLQKLALGNA